MAAREGCKGHTRSFAPKASGSSVNNEAQDQFMLRANLVLDQISLAIQELKNTSSAS